MAKELELKGNYLYITDTITDAIDKFPASLIRVSIQELNTVPVTFAYTLYYNNIQLPGFCKISFSDIEGPGFTTETEFNDFIDENTGSFGSGNSSTFGTLDDVISELQNLNSSNTQINNNLQTIEAVNVAISGFVDGLENGQIITQGKLDDLLNAINATSANEVNELQNIISFVDGLEAGQTVTNGLLVNIGGYVDDLESLTQTLIDEVDDVEERLTEIRDLLTPSSVTQPIDNDVNSNIPSGFRSVIINNLSGVTNIDFGNPVSYQLGTGRRQDGIVISGEEIGFKNGILPEIVITGGTWQWIGLSPI